MHVDGCAWEEMCIYYVTVSVPHGSICGTWAILDGRVQSLLSDLGLRWLLHGPGTSLPVLWRRAGVSLKPNIPVFLEVPITEALCTDSQGRL